MNKEELLEAIKDLNRYYFDWNGNSEKDVDGNWLMYDDLIDLINKIYEQSE